MAQPIYGSATALAYRSSGALTSRQRMIVWGVIAGLHVAVLGGLAAARIARSDPKPEPALMVSILSQDTAQPQAVSQPQPQAQPTPPKPQPPTPAPQLVASTRTASAMSSSAVEEPVRNIPPAPVPAPPSAPTASQPSAAAAPAITPPSLAAHLNNPQPKYPIAARHRGEEGTTIVLVRVSPDGRAEEVRVDRSSGFPELDAAAVEVVKTRYRFVPARQGDRAVVGMVRFPLQFSLKKR